MFKRERGEGEEGGEIRRKKKEALVIVGCSPGLTSPAIALRTPRQNKRRSGTACGVIPFAQYFDCYLAVGISATAGSELGSLMIGHGEDDSAILAEAAHCPPSPPPSCRFFLDLSFSHLLSMDGRALCNFDDAPWCRARRADSDVIDNPPLLASPNDRALPSVRRKLSIQTRLRTHGGGGEGEEGRIDAE